jgi:hypothetical protein
VCFCAPGGWCTQLRRIEVKALHAFMFHILFCHGWCVQGAPGGPKEAAALANYCTIAHLGATTRTGVTQGPWSNLTDRAYHCCQARVMRQQQATRAARSSKENTERAKKALHGTRTGGGACQPALLRKPRACGRLDLLTLALAAIKHCQTLASSH